MARPLRVDIPDGVYYVTSRGLGRRAIVRDVEDRRKWVEVLDAVATRRRWRVFAWVLLDHHWHLFLQTPLGNLSAGVHDLNVGHVAGFNARHGRRGRLLGDRFRAVLVEPGYRWRELSRHIHLNPVRAGLVRRPEAYRWGSCRACLGLERAPGWLAWEEVVSLPGRTPRAARGEYGRFLAEGAASRLESPLAGVVGSALLGSGEFVAKMRRWIRERMPRPRAAVARALQTLPGVEDIEEAVCRVCRASPEVLRVRGRWGNEARRVAVYLSRRLTGMSLPKLGKRFGGVSGPAVVRIATKVAEDMRSDPRLASRVRQCEKALEARLGRT